MTYIRLSGTHMNSANDRRCVFMPPIWFGQGVALFGIVCQQVSNRRLLLLQPPRNWIQVHLVILLANFVRQTAGPRFDTVKSIPILIVPCFADVDLLVWRESSRPTLVVPRMKHHKASIHNIVNQMVSILARLHHFVLVEALGHAMDGLFGPVIPTCVDPLLAGFVLPQAVDLGDNGFAQIVRVPDMNPIPCAAR